MKTDDDILVNPLTFNQFIVNIRNSKKRIYRTLAKGWELVQKLNKSPSSK
jgi:hypothetical protein